jgi:hypothetical protein
LLLRDESGILQAAVESTDETVLSWARDAHCRYWTESTPLTSETQTLDWSDGLDE